MNSDDILKEAKEAFELCASAEAENRAKALDDLRFGRLGQQWPDNVRQDRERDGRPCLTINRLPAFVRQVTNDVRQNRPSISVRPVDDNADPETAQILTGLIRNIEQVSHADIAYDTAADFAASMGFGYFRIAIDYAADDSFDTDLRIQPITNPFSVYADPYSTSADSADWNIAFVVEPVPKAVFEARYKGAEQIDWDGGYGKLPTAWFDGKNVLVAEYWKREEAPRSILLLSNGETMDEDSYATGRDLFDALGLKVVSERQVKSHAITHRLLTGTEILETTKWAGRYIPVVPVYGEEVNEEGKRHFRSLIRDAKDPQRMFNYWRSAMTELVALAPKAPWVGPQEAFTADPAKWDTANTENHSYLPYKGPIAPQRQEFAGIPAGALQEAMMAADDIKAGMGLFDASLGAAGNEISGVAITNRQREGDVGTFHFPDNLSRAIRHAGCILLDLIPHVYSGKRIVRVIGQDGTTQNVKIGPATVAGPSATGVPPLGTVGISKTFGASLPTAPGPGAPLPNALGAQGAQFPAGAERIYDLTAGKYDLVVQAGPSYTTKRQEAADQMMTLLQAFPQAAPVIGDLVAQNLDWPGADEIAARLRMLLPATLQSLGQGAGQVAGPGVAPGAGGSNANGPGAGPNGGQAISPQVQQAIAAIQALQSALAAANAEVQKLRNDKSVDQARVGIEAFEAQTDRMKAVAEVNKVRAAGGR